MSWNVLLSHGSEYGENHVFVYWSFSLFIGCLLMGKRVRQCVPRRLSYMRCASFMAKRVSVVL